MATPAEQAVIDALSRVTTYRATAEARRNDCCLELRFRRNSGGMADMQTLMAYIQLLQPAPDQMGADERQWLASS